MNVPVYLQLLPPGLLPRLFYRDDLPLPQIKANVKQANGQYLHTMGKEKGHRFVWLPEQEIVWRGDHPPTEQDVPALYVQVRDFMTGHLRWVAQCAPAADLRLFVYWGIPHALVRSIPALFSHLYFWAMPESYLHPVEQGEDHPHFTKRNYTDITIPFMWEFPQPFELGSVYHSEISI